MLLAGEAAVNIEHHSSNRQSRACTVFRANRLCCLFPKHLKGVRAGHGSQWIQGFIRVQRCEPRLSHKQRRNGASD
jgi:hypothetical protein